MIWNLTAILTNQISPQNKAVQLSLKQAELTSNKPTKRLNPRTSVRQYTHHFFFLPMHIFGSKDATNQHDCNSSDNGGEWWLVYI